MIEASERFADRQAKRSDLPIGKAFRQASSADSSVLLAAYRHGSVQIFRMAMAQAIRSVDRAYRDSELSAQVSLVRDIFGNPFRPVVADPAWLTPTAVSLASSIYRERAFDRLPILADALEEAGCTNADLLLHCREPGEHVRGCWAVDLVLGKV